MDTLHLAHEALALAIWVSLPALGVSLVVGLLVAAVQAVTQLQDGTLTFVPKLLAVAGVLAATGPWVGHQLVVFTTRVLLDAGAVGLGR